MWIFCFLFFSLEFALDPLTSFKALSATHEALFIASGNLSKILPNMQHQPFHLRLIASSGTLRRPLLLDMSWISDLVILKLDLPLTISSTSPSSLPASPFLVAVSHPPHVVFTRSHVLAISAAFF
jgi:hypothetical protein